MGSSKDPSPMSLSWDPLGALLEADLAAPEGTSLTLRDHLPDPARPAHGAQGHRLCAEPSWGTSQGLAETGGCTGLPQVLSTPRPQQGLSPMQRLFHVAQCWAHSRCPPLGRGAAALREVGQWWARTHTRPLPPDL